MAANDIILFRKGSYSQWVSANPVLASGEPGHDLTNNVLKIGDGTSNWNTLVSIGGGGGSGSTDVFEYVTTSNFPATGAAAVIYIATDTGRTYRWNSPYYVEIGSVGGGDLRFDLFKPAVPTGVTATGGNAQAVVSWTAPTVLAQTPITDYVVQFSTNSGSTYTTSADGTSTATTATVTGLTNGTAHVFRVAAVNALGTGAFSAASAAVTPTAGDALFASVALLLPMDGTGNTFVDASATPKTLTALGNVTQSTAQSKWGGKSAYFDGNGDTIQLPSLGLVNTDFVIEMWLYMLGTDSDQVIATTYNTPVQYGTFILFRIATGRIRFQDPLGTAATSAVLNVNQWYHVAAVYKHSTTQYALFIDGVRTPLVTAGAITSQAAQFHIGGSESDNNIGTWWLNGYIDDLRVTVGSDRGYTGATITVPTAAFPTRGIYEDPFMESVSLLLPMDGTGATFIDSSLAPKTITAFGYATQSTAQSKWGGKSAYFDGDGDSIGSTSITFAGSFVVECWIRWNGAIGRDYSAIAIGTTANTQFFLTTKQNRTGLRFGLSGVAEYGSASFAWVPDTWYYIALVRSGSAIRMYVNGANVTDGSPAAADTFTGELRLAGDNSGLYNSNIYIDDFRVTVGSDRGYTGATITVPTAAFPTS